MVIDSAPLNKNSVKHKFKRKDLVYIHHDLDKPEYDLDYDERAIVFYTLEECTWYDGMEWMRKRFIDEGYEYAVCCFFAGDMGETTISELRLVKEEEISIFDRKKYAIYADEYGIHNMGDAFDLTIYKAENGNFIPAVILAVEGISDDLFDLKKAICFNLSFRTDGIRLNCLFFINSFYLDIPIFLGLWVEKAMIMSTIGLFLEIPKENIKEIKNAITLEAISDGEKLFMDNNKSTYLNGGKTGMTSNGNEGYKLKATSQFKIDYEKLEQEPELLKWLHYYLKHFSYAKDYYDRCVAEHVYCTEILDRVTELQLIWGKDWYLIYKINTELSTIMLYRVGRYSDLFNGEWKSI